jgi:DNA polymerase-1
MSERLTVWILDAHCQIFRAYHSMPDLRSPDGTPTGALRGYAAMLIKLLSEQKPTHFAAAWDPELTSFRNDLHPGYKLGRTDPPLDLAPQFELCAELTRALGIRVFAAPSFEADDVMASLTATALDEGADVMLATPDKDLSALVSERVSLFDPKKNERLGPREVEARLGVPPALVPDYLTLVGDAVDCIPGVSGIGPRTASTLLKAFGRIEDIPSDWRAWAGLNLRGAERMARALAEGRESIELSRALVHMRDDLLLGARVADLAWRGADRAAFAAFCERHALRGLSERVPRFAD